MQKKTVFLVVFETRKYLLLEEKKKTYDYERTI